jgi:hypothetical protein
VAAQGSAIRADGGGGAIGVKVQRPAPAVDDDEVMESAQWHQVVQRRGPAFGAGNHMVDLAQAGGVVAAGERAARMAGGRGAAQVGGDGWLGLADVQG